MLELQIINLNNNQLLFSSFLTLPIRKYNKTIGNLELSENTAYSMNKIWKKYNGLLILIQNIPNHPNSLCGDKQEGLFQHKFGEYSEVLTEIINQMVEIFQKRDFKDTKKIISLNQEIIDAINQKIFHFDRSWTITGIPEEWNALYRIISKPNPNLDRIFNTFLGLNHNHQFLFSIIKGQMLLKKFQGKVISIRRLESGRIPSSYNLSFYNVDNVLILLDQFMEYKLLFNFILNEILPNLKSKVKVGKNLNLIFVIDQKEKKRIESQEFFAQYAGKLPIYEIDFRKKDISSELEKIYENH